MNKELNIQILIGFLVLLLLFYYLKFGKKSLLFVKSSMDEQFHLVRNLPDKKEAAEILAEIKKRLKILIDYCMINHPNREEVQFIKQRYNENNISETDLSDSGTSYSIDKGKEVHLCIRNKEDAKLHQINLLMYVSVHELAHISATSFGHNSEFGENFKWLLQQAVKCGIYTPVDYSKKAELYCGMDVNSNILFD